MKKDVRHIGLLYVATTIVVLFVLMTVLIQEPSNLLLLFSSDDGNIDGFQHSVYLNARIIPMTLSVVSISSVLILLRIKSVIGTKQMIAPIVLLTISIFSIPIMNVDINGGFAGVNEIRECGIITSLHYLG